jgi:hypothetical protein
LFGSGLVLPLVGADAGLGGGQDGGGGLVEVEVALAGELPHRDAFEAVGEVVGVVVEELADVGVRVEAGWVVRYRRRAPRRWPMFTE